MSIAEHNLVRDRLAARSIETTGFALLFLMLFVPAAYQPLKACLLLVIVAALLSRIAADRRIALHPEVAWGCLLFSVVGMAYVLRGYLSGAPGALRVSTVYVIWPLTNALLMTGLAQEARLWRLARVLVATTLAICFYCASYILWSAGWWPDVLYPALDAKQRIGFYDGFIEFNVTSQSSLLFLVPFVAAAILCWPRRGAVARIWLWLALTLGLIMGLLSGRRAFQLVLALTPLVALTFWRMLPRDQRAERRSNIKRSMVSAIAVAALALVVLQTIYGFNPNVVWATFKTGFHFSTDPVAHTRATQFDALIDGWLSSPLFGSGHGAQAPGVIRSENTPWAYELAYMALLFHTGLLGLLFYALGVSWIYLEGVRVIRRGSVLSPLMASVLTGTSTFLIANATNPYLEKFDCVWTLFLPLAIVNASLLTERSAANFTSRAGFASG